MPRPWVAAYRKPSWLTCRSNAVVRGSENRVSPGRGPDPAPPDGVGVGAPVGDQYAEVGADDELVADHDHVGGGDVGEADGQVGPGDGDAGRGLGELAAVDVLDAGAGAFDEPPVEPVEDQVDR
jgi:hypothetical protein